jgi:hypothetical protein
MQSNDPADAAVHPPQASRHGAPDPFLFAARMRRPLAAGLRDHPGENGYCGLLDPIHALRHSHRADIVHLRKQTIQTK